VLILIAYVKHICLFIIKCSFIVLCLMPFHSNIDYDVLEAQQFKQTFLPEVGEKVHRKVIWPEYDIAGDVYSLKKQATYIVIGHYETFVQQADMGSGYSSELYTFEVEEAIKGDLQGKIEVSLPSHRLETVKWHNKSYEVRFQLQNYVKPDPSQTMILFLSEQKDGVFPPSSHLFQISIHANGTAQLLYNTLEQIERIHVSQLESIEVELRTDNLTAIDRVTGKPIERLLEVLRSSE